MKNLPSILAAIFLAGVLVLYMCTFQVRSTEVAILKTFGQANPEPIGVPENDDSFFAGLHFKWPWPIQSVAKYDRRIRLLEDRIEETPTQDSKQVIITTFTGWTISDGRGWCSPRAGSDGPRRRRRAGASARRPHRRGRRRGSHAPPDRRSGRRFPGCGPAGHG